MNLEITEGSSLSVRSEVDVFSRPATDVGITYSTTQEVYPLNSTKERFAGIQYHVEGNSTFIDLGNSLLKVLVQVTKHDEVTELADNESVSTVNNFLHSIFQSAELSLGDYPVTSLSNNYAYKAYFISVLGNGAPFKATAAQAAMYYQDTKGDDYTDANTGMVARKKQIAKSKIFEMIGPLFLDLAQQKRYIINNVDVKIKLCRSSDDFVLWSPTARTAGSNVCPYTVKILSAVYYVRRHTLSVNLFNRIQMELNKRAARYTYDRCEIKTFNIIKGLTSGSSDNLFMGQIPQLIVIAMNNSVDVAGKLSTNPYNFGHFNVKKIALSVDSDVALYRSLEFNIAANQYLNGYMSLFTAASNRDLGNNLTMADYLNGYFFNVFELVSPTTGDDLLPERRGRLKVELDFDKALAEPITVIIFAQYQAYIDIDVNRVVKASG